MSLSLRRPLRCRLSLLTVVLFLGFALVACGPRTAEELAEDRARVVGTWEYWSSGIGVLQNGTLRISVEGATLVGHLQDTWRGTLDARIDLQGSRMELTLDRVRIRGRLERDRFLGAVYSPMWDASHGSTYEPYSEGRFVARRIGPSSFAEDSRELGCPSLLYESSFACSPLEP